MNTYIFGGALGLLCCWLVISSRRITKRLGTLEASQQELVDEWGAEMLDVRMTAVERRLDQSDQS